MLREGSGGRRPWKVWDASRNVKRVVLASSLDELRDRGREKLGCDHGEAIRLVLECDGTHIDDEDYLRWLPDNTIFLLLRPGEQWSAGHRQLLCRSDSLTTPIPRVVCEALNLLEIRQEPPFWKIVDNRGRITLVLHWEQTRNHPIPYLESDRLHSATTTTTTAAAAAGRSYTDGKTEGGKIHSGDDIVTVVSESGGAITTLRGGKMETLINNVHHSHHHHHGTTASSSSVVAAVTTTTATTLPPRLSSKDRLCSQDSVTSSGSGSVPYRVAATIHVPQTITSLQPNSPTHDNHSADECEFHCGSLHEEGRAIRGAEGREARIPSSSTTTSTSSKNVHVRFQESLIGQESLRKGSSAAARRGSTGSAGRESSESDFEPESNNTVEEELDNEGVTTEKLLLLTDQLSADQRKHLTILDLGVILDRLKAKIIDVERLEREREGPSCFRWTIKATIRGEVLRDLGVLYNGNYYSISEHPGIAYEGSAFEDDDEDREDPV